MSGSGRKLSPLEQKLHQAALADPKKVCNNTLCERYGTIIDDAASIVQTITQKECDALVPDPSARLAAINFLLGTVRSQLSPSALRDVQPLHAWKL